MLSAHCEHVGVSPIQHFSFADAPSVARRKIQMARRLRTTVSIRRRTNTLSTAKTFLKILASMTMAALYDGSGGWAWHVGLPAKSGIGGVIVAIPPGKGAVAVFALSLDEAGNSVKAQK